MIVSAISLTEVLRGGPRDALIRRVLSRIVVLPVGPELGRRAGELLGETGLSGHRCAIDAVVAATALELPRPLVLLTSDPNDLTSDPNDLTRLDSNDLTRLVEEPDRPRSKESPWSTYRRRLAGSGGIASCGRTVWQM